MMKDELPSTNRTRIHELESVIRVFVKKFVDGLFTPFIRTQFLPEDFFAGVMSCRSSLAR
jgi:hypothetical protein